MDGRVSSSGTIVDWDYDKTGRSIGSCKVDSIVCGIRRRIGFCRYSSIGYAMTIEGSEKKKNNFKKILIGVVGLSVGEDSAVLTLALHFPNLF